MSEFDLSSAIAGAVFRLSLLAAGACLAPGPLAAMDAAAHAAAHGVFAQTEPAQTRAAEAPAVAIPVAAAQTMVSIDNFTFGPAEITVAPGTTVTWVNNDDIPHTVVATDKSFKSKVLDTEGAFSYTFTSVGEFQYFCSLHPHMTGMVRVKVP